MKPNKGRKRKLNSKTFIQENFSDQQWQSFDSGEKIPVAKSDEMYRFVLNHISAGQEKKTAIRIRLAKLTHYASVACVVLLLSFALYLGLNNVSNNQPANLSGEQTKISSATSADPWKTISNKTNKNLSYRLPDYSVVTIYPRSTIKFKRAFDQKFRNVYLNGKAKFKVKRNTERPFSVYSGALKTTALGTSFTINTQGDRISVRLHTGKIVVANTQAKNQLTYIANAGTTLVYSPFLGTTKIIEATKVTQTVPEIIKHDGNIIIMKNIPLSKVFNLLHHAYGINISTDHDEINNINFTGNVNTVIDQPEDILKVICLINNMTFTKMSDEEFLIKRSINKIKQHPDKL